LANSLSFQWQQSHELVFLLLLSYFFNWFFCKKCFNLAFIILFSLFFWFFI
jgi:hypothetical protein